MKKNNRVAAHLLGHRRSHIVARIAGLCVLAIALTGASAVGFGYLRLQGNITEHDVTTDLGTNRPTLPADANAGNALNILLLGSDVRSGESDIDGLGASGDVVGMRADTTMILHISSDRSRVDVVSIPRDMLVDIPECVVRNEAGDVVSTHRAQRDVRFNAAFATGGAQGNVGSAAACAMQTVEQMTGVRLSGFMVANFAAFRNIVDVIGGVPVYFDEDLQDSYSGLNVSTGCRLLDGNQALALARARHNIGDGSDIGRIGRQQDLVKAIAHEAMSLNLFTDMGALYQVLNAVTSNLETSSGLGSIPTLAGLAASLRGLDFSKITFITMPFEYAGAAVAPRKGAEVLWNSLINDKPITITVDSSGAITDTSASSTTPAPTDAPSSDSAVNGSLPSQMETEGPDQSSTATSQPAASGVDASASAAPQDSPATAPACTKANATR